MILGVFTTLILRIRLSVIRLYGMLKLALLFIALIVGTLQAQSVPVPEDVAAPPRDAQKTASGLASKVLTPGKGTEHPTAMSEVTVHYSGWTTDGKMFDSSVARNEPATFPLSRVIKGWTEGVQLMVVGEKRRFWIPGPLAYDNSTRQGVPKGMLVFDVELLAIK
jgi:FKBP-type peptidyl-prolyl cis-trans isomerase